MLLSLWTVSLALVSSPVGRALEREVPVRAPWRVDVLRERVLSEWLLYGGLGM
jgi:hypothetical protein